MTLENPKYKWSFLGVSVDTEIIRAIDAMRAEVPRSKIVQSALRQFLESNNVKNVQGPKVNQPLAQAPPHTPTSTTTNAVGTLEVDRSLRHMATTEGSWRIGGGIVDVKGK
jgi:hypothetical protein